MQKAHNSLFLSHGAPEADQETLDRESIHLVTDAIQEREAVMLTVLGTQVDGTFYNAVDGTSYPASKELSLNSLRSLIVSGDLVPLADHFVDQMRDKSGIRGFTEVITIVVGPNMVKRAIFPAANSQNPFYGDVNDLEALCNDFKADYLEFAEEWHVQGGEDGGHFVAFPPRCAVMRSTLLEDGGLWGSHIWICEP